MKRVYLLLTTMFLLGCEKPLEEVEDKKSYDITKMDLGMALWKRQIILFDGDLEKADSAYSVDKKILIDDIYKTAKKVENKNDVSEKECGHIFFNRYCHFCREYRLKN